MTTRNKSHARVLRAALLGPALLLVAGAASAGEKTLKLEDVPKPVQETIKAQSKDAKIVKIETEKEEGKLLYELESAVGDHRRDVLIDPSGKVVEVEVEMPLASTPPAVQEGIKKKAGESKILKIESLAKGDEKVYAYEVHVKQGAKKHSFKIAPDGTPMPHSHS